MRINNILFRVASDDFIGSAFLTVATEMSTGYRGRGLVSIAHTFPVGTPVTISIRRSGEGKVRIDYKVESVIVDSSSNCDPYSNFTAFKEYGDYDEFVAKFNKRHPGLNTNNPATSSEYMKRRHAAWDESEIFSKTYKVLDKAAKVL